MAFGACFPIVSYTIQSSAPPFPVLCLSYVISGVGIGFQVSSNSLNGKEERVKLTSSSTFTGYSNSSLHCETTQHVSRVSMYAQVLI